MEFSWKLAMVLNKFSEKMVDNADYHITSILLNIAFIIEEINMICNTNQNGHD